MRSFWLTLKEEADGDANETPWNILDSLQSELDGLASDIRGPSGSCAAPVSARMLSMALQHAVERLERAKTVLIKINEDGSGKKRRR